MPLPRDTCTGFSTGVRLAVVSTSPSRTTRDLAAVRLPGVDIAADDSGRRGHIARAGRRRPRPPRRTQDARRHRRRPLGTGCSRGARRHRAELPRHAHRHPRQAGDGPPASPFGASSPVDATGPPRATPGGRARSRRGQAPARKLGQERRHLRDGRVARLHARGHSRGGVVHRARRPRAGGRSSHRIGSPRHRRGRSRRRRRTARGGARGVADERRSRRETGARHARPHSPPPGAGRGACDERSARRSRPLADARRRLHDPRAERRTVDLTHEYRSAGDIYRETAEQLCRFDTSHRSPTPRRAPTSYPSRSGDRRV